MELFEQESRSEKDIHVLAQWYSVFYKYSMVSTAAADVALK
jgi:hypothetical protein